MIIIIFTHSQKQKRFIILIKKKNYYQAFKERKVLKNNIKQI